MTFFPVRYGVCSISQIFFLERGVTATYTHTHYACLLLEEYVLKVMIGGGIKGKVREGKVISV